MYIKIILEFPQAKHIKPMPGSLSPALRRIKAGAYIRLLSYPLYFITLARENHAAL